MGVPIVRMLEKIILGIITIVGIIKQNTIFVVVGMGGHIILDLEEARGYLVFLITLLCEEEPEEDGL